MASLGRGRQTGRGRLDIRVRGALTRQWESASTIAKLLELARQSVSAKLDELVDEGVAERGHEAVGVSRTTRQTSYQHVYRKAKVGRG